ncbi:MAG: hypothetical protein BRC50_11925 [Cyanobacteria bacterium SW_11_48_12]|nr:MAG: hypothetical protein BRC50_11925 [Cyanobacteria bacterium SW_11_48_12]
MTKKDAGTQRAEELSGSRGGRGSRGHGRGAEGQRGRGAEGKQADQSLSWAPGYLCTEHLRVSASSPLRVSPESVAVAAEALRARKGLSAPGHLTLSPVLLLSLRASESRRIAPTRHFPLSASSWSHLLEEQANDNLDSIKRLRLYLKVFQGMVIDGISN